MIIINKSSIDLAVGAGTEFGIRGGLRYARGINAL